MKLPPNVISALVEYSALVNPGVPPTYTNRKRLRRLETICDHWWGLRGELADLVYKEREEGISLTETEASRYAELCEMFRDWPGVSAQMARESMGLV